MRDGVNRIDGKHLNYVAGFEVVLAIAAFGVGGIDGEPPGGSLRVSETSWLRSSWSNS